MQAFGICNVTTEMPAVERALHLLKGWGIRRGMNTELAFARQFANFLFVVPLYNGLERTISAFYRDRICYLSLTRSILKVMLRKFVFLFFPLFFSPILFSSLFS